jgi:preprotein translocase subunit SecG
VITSVPGHKSLELLATGFQVLVGTVCPFVIIFASNVIIIVTLHKANRERAMMDSRQSTEETKSQKETRFLTRMLIFVSVAYVLTSLPYRMYHFVVRIPEVAAMFHNMATVYWRLRYIVGAYCFFLIWLFNYAINFYLYCIGGGKRYRDDTRDVMRNVCKCFGKDIVKGVERKSKILRPSSTH